MAKRDAGTHEIVLLDELEVYLEHIPLEMEILGNKSPTVENPQRSPDRRH